MIDWLAMMVARVASRDQRDAKRVGAELVEDVARGGRSGHHDCSLAGINQREAREDECAPREADRAGRQMAHIGIERFRAGNAQKDPTQHQKSCHPAIGRKPQAIARIERPQDRQVARNAPDAERRDGQEPGSIMGPNAPPIRWVPSRCNRNRRIRIATDPGSTKVWNAGEDDIEALQRREYRDRRSDGAVAIDQGRAEQAAGGDERPLQCLCARSDIRARMPPSPSLSMRIARPTYLTVVITISVQTISDSEPITAGAAGWAPVTSSTVFSV